MQLSRDRHIAHFDLDSLFIAAEQLKNSTLKNKPLIIGGTGDRAMVIACSPEAEKFGIYRTQLLRTARVLCPCGIFVKADPEQYSKHSRVVTDIINDSVPLFEKSAIDRFYVDLTGMDKFFGCYAFSKELKAKILKESGLSTSWALATNKLISRLASDEARPNGQVEISIGEEKAFLSPLSVVKIPNIGLEKAFLLMKMGIETIHGLRQIPVENLINLLGPSAIEIARNANGIDDTPVAPYKEQKAITESINFDQDTIDVKLLQASVIRLAEQAAFTLRQQNRLTGCVSVLVRYSSGESSAKQAVIPYTNTDSTLLATAKQLLEKAFNRRILIRTMALKLSSLIPGTYQITLFDDTAESIGLYRSIDQVKNRFGEKFLMRAGAIDAHTIKRNV